MPRTHLRNEITQGNAERVRNAVQRTDLGGNPPGFDFDDRFAVHSSCFRQPIYRHPPFATQPSNLDAECAEVWYGNWHKISLVQ